MRVEDDVLITKCILCYVVVSFIISLYTEDVVRKGVIDT